MSLTPPRLPRFVVWGPGPKRRKPTAWARDPRRKPGTAAPPTPPSRHHVHQLSAGSTKVTTGSVQIPSANFSITAMPQRPEMTAATSKTQFRLGGLGGAGGSGLAPPMPAVAEFPGRNGAGAKPQQRRSRLRQGKSRSEAHAEPGELT